ncbi:MAG: aminotransferase class V-fold PLP-dependent enzyme, partial [Bacteroidia bacterium]|nr:aminotransferase class V-fold PLP-dependent enzyme [Bacteroidia bacterium]
IVHKNNSILMSDATQAIGKTNVDVQELGIDLMCLSAHKFYGPKGSGALYIRRKNPRVSLSPQIHGGGHENSLRSGTLNIPAIVGLGKAIELSAVITEWQQSKTKKLRDYLESTLLKEVEEIKIIGASTERLPNTSNIQFPIKSNTLIKKMMDVAVSTGSACTSAKPEPSHVLLSMGLSKEEADKCIRFSLGIKTTKEELDYTIEKIKKIITENSVLS